MENKKFYIESVALDARKKMIKEKYISDEDKNFSLSSLKKIINFFGGELKSISKQQEKRLAYITKDSEDNKFTIYYKDKNKYMSIIHELGHAFFDLSSMIVGEERPCSGTSLSDFQAELFARAFVMPRNNFEKIVTEYIYDGKCDVQKVADEYKIDYFDVLARGKELNIWE